MLMRMRWVVVVALVMAAGARVSAEPVAPEPVVARVQALLAAFNATPEEYEKYALDAFAGQLLGRTPDQRKRQFERIRTQLGKLQAKEIRREAPTRVVVTVEGETGNGGTLTLEHQAEPPHKFTSMRFSLEVDPAKVAQAAAPVSGRMTADELSAALDRYVAALTKEDQFAGSVLVARDGQPLFEKAYGLASRAWTVPNTPQTRFSVGSINKFFTRVAIGQLLAAGKLTLADPIAKHISDYPNPAARKATIEQLLEMQGGLGDLFGPAYTAAPKDRFRSNRDYFQFVAPLPLVFEPGTNRQYCNSCYIVLGEIIERLSGTPYEKYIEQHVFRRAGMQTAAFVASDGIAPNVAVGYTKREGPLRSNVHEHGAAGSAAGSAYATARDMLAFDEALRRGVLLDPERTAWFLKVDALPQGRAATRIVYAGGAAGMNAEVDSGPTWTVIALANMDPRAAQDVASAIYRALTAE